jgi:hexosaminidase
MLTLLPIPRLLEFHDGNYKLDSGKRIALLGAPAQELLFSAQRLHTILCEQQIEWTLAATITGDPQEIGATLRVDSAHVKNAEEYELTITPNGIELVAGSPRGIFYGVCTLVQLITQSPNHQIPCLHIADYPDFPNRGVMLDISRDKVPTMATLFDLVDLFASWKINQLQLYTEHTFTYRNHREVWEHASPMTEQDILELDAVLSRTIHRTGAEPKFVWASAPLAGASALSRFGRMSRWLRYHLGTF